MISGYPDEDGQTTFNPFSKARNSRNPRRKTKSDDRNDEQGLNRTQSEGNTLDSTEVQRRSQYSGPSVPHFQTMPENVKDPPSSTVNGGAIPGMQMNEKQEKLDPPREASEESSSRALPEEPSPVGDQSGGQEDNSKSHRHSPFPAFLRNRHKNKDLESGSNSHGSEPEERIKPKFTAWSQIRYSLFNSWINVLLVCAPIGIALHFVPGLNPIVIFVVNFIAIIPLAGTLSYATEEIALRTGETIGGLLNASFGYASFEPTALFQTNIFGRNAVELIVSIIALFQNQILIVQTSLIGSMLSNLLLVMGKHRLHF